MVVSWQEREIVLDYQQQVEELAGAFQGAIAKLCVMDDRATSPPPDIMPPRRFTMPVGRMNTRNPPVSIKL